MKALLLVKAKTSIALVCLMASVGGAQQWTGNADTSSTIHRSGPVGIGIATAPSGNQELVVEGGAGTYGGPSQMRVTHSGDGNTGLYLTLSGSQSERYFVGH